MASSVLLTESASLTCRETLTVLGRSGLTADVISSGRLTIGQFSRWRRRSFTLPPPNEDPAGFVVGLGRLVRSGRYRAVLPTHEQAWLLAVGRSLLPPGTPVALADPSAFDRVQSKVAFARLLDELGLPQPRWWMADAPPVDAPVDHWVKAAYSTAGRGVLHVTSPEAARAAARSLGGPGIEVMGQAPAPGQYGQVQALFDRGRLGAVHCSVQEGVGAGGSAAARRSVDHPEAVEAVAVLGRALDWHGGLTVDYFHVDGHPRFIECNPRTVEPGNAAAAGVDLPGLTAALAAGIPLPDPGLTGRAGVRTHSTGALLAGAAERTGRRHDVLAALVRHGGPIGPSEVLTPINEDGRALVPLVYMAATLLISPTALTRLSGDAVGRYSVTPATVNLLRRQLDDLGSDGPRGRR